MEYETEIREKLGSENVDLILSEIGHGRIKEEELKIIAHQMHGNVHGVFVDKIRERSQHVHVFMHMLDSWFNEVLCEPSIDGRRELHKILEDVKLHALAAKLKGVTLPGLPVKHHILDLPPDESSNDSIPVSDHSEVKCLSQCMGKAVKDILAEHKYESDLQDIIEALSDNGGHTEEFLYPDEFDKIEIDLKIIKEDGEEHQMRIRVKVETYWGNIDCIHSLSTVPVADSGEQTKTPSTTMTDSLDEDIKKMILLLDTGMPLTPLPHVIYAKDYDHSTGNYSCIKVSDGSEEIQEIHNSRVLAVNYISCAKLRSYKH